MIDIPLSLRAVLKRLRLSGIALTLDERITYARKHELSEAELFELVLQDEIDRRDHKSLAARLTRAGFEGDHTLEHFDFDAPVTFDRQRVISDN